MFLNKRTHDSEKFEIALGNLLYERANILPSYNKCGIAQKLAES